MFLSYNVFLKTDIIMIMKQVLKRTDTIMAACLSALLFSWLPVSANSALQYWEGSDASGVMTTDQDCPVVVGHETLTFMLDDAKEPDSMDRFAAEYTFVNPSDLQVTASLAFPFGSRPFYLTSSASYDDPSLYRVLVNGEEIEPAVRYTWLGTEKFSVGKDLARLRDGYIEDAFFRKDLPVYQYTLHFSLEDEGMFEESGCYIQAETDVINDPARIRYLLSGDFAGYGNDQSRAYIVMSLSQKKQDAVVYTFGQESDFAFTSFRTTENTPREMQGSCTVTKTGEMTYEEYVMANKPADLAISDIDHYNALTEMFRSDEDFRFIMPDLYGYEGGLMKWYTYQLAFGPGETLTNTVEAPIWPSVDASYEEPEYEYRYLLSPALGNAGMLTGRLCKGRELLQGTLRQTAGRGTVLYNVQHCRAEEKNEWDCICYHRLLCLPAAGFPSSDLPDRKADQKDLHKKVKAAADQRLCCISGVQKQKA